MAPRNRRYSSSEPRRRQGRAGGLKSKIAAICSVPMAALARPPIFSPATRGPRAG